MKIRIESTAEAKARQKKMVHYSSSTVFFVINSPTNKIQTNVSLLNHFLLKRSIKLVKARIDLRNLQGDLVDSYEIDITEPKAYSFNPLRENKEFIGAVYVYFSSEENLAVPFCAVIQTIECKESLCGVHTYGRVLEDSELGTTIDLKSTIESGWTLRDTIDISSFAVFHNGREECRFNLELEVSNHAGEIRKASWDESVKSYQTLLLIPKTFIEDLDSFLNGHEGHAKLSINGLSGTFPRMMCGNFKATESSITAASEIQFTHTNFDYSNVSQPDSNWTKAYFNQPSINAGKGIAYPTFLTKPGEEIHFGDRKIFPGKINIFDVPPASQVVVSCNNNLPSRLVAATIADWGNNLDSECSTGIYIQDYLKVPCHWHWGLFKADSAKLDNCVITIFQNNFDEQVTDNCSINFSLYDNEGLLHQDKIVIKEAVNTISFNSLKKRFDLKAVGDLWYVFSGEKLEHLNIFATHYTNIGNSGFVEHAF